ncbi:MAG: SDR family NAD(P)-dependent oxidoreductase [Actinomycetia bacterium]|nr:SDR family NAD(P)-dependent oxidoreductase [Actinomycetes bacterium]
MQDLEGRTSVITGAASGMGLAFAHRFARAGMDIVLADIEEPALDETAAQVAASVSLVTDVSGGVPRTDSGSSPTWRWPLRSRAGTSRFSRTGTHHPRSPVSPSKLEADHVTGDAIGLKFERWRW